MKKFLLLLFVALTGLAHSVYGQTVIQIGTGTTAPSVGTNPGTGANGASPYGINVGSGSGGKRVQILYTAAQINTALTTAGLTPGVPYIISTTSWDVSSNVGAASGNQTGTTIRMKNTAATALATGSPETSLTTVFGPTNVTFPTSGTGYLVTNTLASTFTWDGTSNLAVEYCFTVTGVGGASTYGACRRTATGSNQIIYTNVGCSQAFVTAVAAISNMRVTVTPACTPPTVQASGGSSSGLGVSTATLNWSGNGNGNAGVLVVVRPTSSGIVAPVNTTTYTANAIYGSGSTTGTGNYVVYKGTGNTVNVTGLQPNTNYSYAIYSFNSGGPCYMASPFTGTFATTSCGSFTNATALTYSNVTGNSMDVSFTRGNGSNVIVLARAGSAVNSNPLYTVGYTASGAFGSGDQIGTGNYVVYNGTGSSFTMTGLSSATAYHFAVYEYNTSPNCYTTSPLTGNQTTLDVTTPGTLGVACYYTGANTSSVTYNTVQGLGGSTNLATTTFDDANYTAPVASPAFGFAFKGVNYTTFGINANGFIWFGSGSPAASYASFGGNPIASSNANLGGTGTIDGIIAAYGVDQWNKTSISTAPATAAITVNYTGTAPGRVCTIEWNGIVTETATQGGSFQLNRIDYQIKLYESGHSTTPNRIELLYRSQQPYLISATQSAGAIGLRGASNADVNTRTAVVGAWNSSTLGTASSTCLANDGSLYIPTTNYGFNYTPITLTTPTVTPTSGSNTCPTSSVTLTSSSATNNQWYKDGVIIPGPGSTSQTYVATESGTYNVRVNNGLCYTALSNNAVVTITPCMMQWTGALSTDWNTPGNWTPAGPPTLSNDILIPNMPNDPDLSVGSSGKCRAVTINSGATLIIGSGKTIDVKGNWTAANNVVSGAGKLILSANATQTISGGSTFSNLQLFNLGTTIASGSNLVNITAGLDLRTGVLTTNNNLVIKSTASTQGYIDDFSSGFSGSISGNLKVERYITSLNTGFRYIGAPVNTGSGVLNLSGLSGFTVSGTPGQFIPQPDCNPNAAGPGSPYGTFMRWEEAGPFMYSCRLSGWYFQTTGSMTLGRGYGAKLSGGNTVIYTGAVNTGTISYGPLSYNGAVGNGWQLVANPYPSSMAINNTDGPTGNNMPAGFDGQIQFYITSGPYTGSYLSYNVGISAAPIALGQGFWVRTSTSGTFTLSNAHRVTNSVSYFDANQQIQQHLKVDVAGNGFMDKTDIYFLPSAQSGYDFYDAEKWDSNNDQPTLYTKVGSTKASINSLASLEETVVVPMGVKPGSTGNFTFTFGDIASFPQTSMIYLEDLVSGTMTDLRANNSYSFSMGANDNADRFMLHFQPGLKADVANQGCDNMGSIELTQAAPTVWSTYEVRGNDNNVYAQGANFTGNIAVNNLPAQEYVITVTNASGYTAQEYITVNGVSTLTASINASATDVAIDQNVDFIATSNNATAYVWEFGDGNMQFGSSTAQHSYDVAGTYNVTLTSSNNECNNVSVKTINVSNTTGIDNNTANNIKVYGYGERVVIDFNTWGGNKADIFMYNTLGQRIESLTGVSTVKGRHELNLANVKPGYYFIQVVSDGKVQGKKLFLGSK